MFKNKKEEEKFIDDVFDILDRIKRIAGVDYEFTIIIEKNDSDENAYTVGHEEVFAKVEVNVHYHHATLTLFPVAVKTWKRKDFFGFTSSLCHEVAHTITEPLIDLFYQTHTSEQEVRREQEYTTEKIGRIIYDLYFQTYKRNLGKKGEFKKVIHRKKFDKKKKKK